MHIRKTTTLTRGLAALALVTLAACSGESALTTGGAGGGGQAQAAQVSGSQSVQLVHVHGLAYSADGQHIYIPSHMGLAIYDHASWRKAPGPEHDYMGFVSTRDAFYSSGHPAMGSGLVNPFGLIKSTNGGQTWAKLGLEGETDFHNLAAGYNTNVIYVFNPAPSSKMKEAGLYRTADDGQTWQKAQAKGIDSEPFTLAVHPDDPQKVAVAAKAGLYLSKDGGNNFTKVASTPPLTAVQYDFDGRRVWYATYEDNPALHVYDTATGKSEAAGWPQGEKDPVAYIAQNPVKKDEYATATFTRSVYLSADGTKTWQAVAKEGQTISK